MLTPIIVPLGPMRMPMQPQDHDYHRYRPAFDNSRGVVHGMVPPAIRNIPQMMENPMRAGQHPVSCKKSSFLPQKKRRTKK